MDDELSSSPPARASLVGRLAGLMGNETALGQRTVMVLACKVAASLLLLAANALLARLLGVTGYGELSYVITVVNLATAVAIVGFPGLTVREIGYYTAENDDRAIRLFVRRTLLVVSLTSLAAVALTWVVLSLTGYPSANIALVMAIGIWIIPANALLRVAQPIVQGLNRPVLGVLAEFILRPSVMLLLTATVWFLLGPPQPPQSMILLHLISYAAAAALALSLVWRLLPADQGAGARKTFTLYMQEGMPFFISGFLTSLNLQLPILMLGNMVDATTVGLFRPAALIAETLNFVLLGLNIPLRPLVARSYRAGEITQMQRQITWAARFVFAIALVGFVVFALFGRTFLGIFGEAFVVAYPALVILCLGQLANVAFGPVVLVLNMTRQARFTVYGMLLGVAANFLLCLLLIPPFGIIGAATGAAVSLVVWNLTLSIIAQKRTGVSSSIFGPLPLVARTRSGDGR
jgi:O-antigen/teichoic acid export membrane protein